MTLYSVNLFIISSTGSIPYEEKAVNHFAELYGCEQNEHRNTITDSEI